jgi:hypothetical protein
LDACISDGDGKKADSVPELLALREKLARLVADDLDAVIDFEMPAPAGSTKAAEAHRKRTAQYKSEQLLALTPDSQAIAQACSYLVRSLRSKSQVALELLERLVGILAAAGYERLQTEAAIDRLLIDLDRRQAMWQRSRVRKLSSALAAAIRGLHGNNGHGMRLDPANTPVLRKPFGFEELTAILTRLLSR